MNTAWGLAVALGMAMVAGTAQPYAQLAEGSAQASTEEKILVSSYYVVLAITGARGGVMTHTRVTLINQGDEVLQDVEFELVDLDLLIPRGNTLRVGALPPHMPVTLNWNLLTPVPIRNGAPLPLFGEARPENGLITGFGVMSQFH